MNNKNFIGDRLYYLREQSGLTLQDLADKIEGSKGHLSEIETGRVLPSLHMLIRLCEFYNISLPEFFYDKGVSIEVNKAQRDLIDNLLKITEEMTEERINYLNKFLESFRD